MPQRRTCLVTCLTISLAIACTQRTSRTATTQPPDSIRRDLAGEFNATPQLDASYQVIMQRVASPAASDTAPLVRRTIGVVGLQGDTILLTRGWAPTRNGAAASAGGNDSLILTHDDLMPVRERLDAQGAIRTFTYDGPHITGTIAPTDSAPRQFDHTFPEAPLAFNEVDLLVRSAPFRNGYSVVVPLFSEMDEAIEHDTITVLGTEKLGDRNGWRVRFADPAIVAEYVVDEASREILSHELTQRTTGVRLRFIVGG